MHCIMHPSADGYLGWFHFSSSCKWAVISRLASISVAGCRVLSMCPRVVKLGHTVTPFLVFANTQHPFPLWLHQFTLPLRVNKGSLPTSSSTFAFLISFSANSFLVSTKPTCFYTPILYPANLLKVFIRPRWLSVEFMGSLKYIIMSSAN